MKRKMVLLPFFLVSIYVTLTGYSAGPAITSGVDGTGATNSGGCSCHGVSATTAISVALELDSAGFPVTNYIAGRSYTIKITSTQTSSFFTLPKFGFQVAAVSLSGAGTASAVGVGTFPSAGLPTGSRLVSSSTSGLPMSVVEHSSSMSATSGSGGSGTTYVNSIPWTAPVAGTGSIRIYGVINAVDNDGSSSGDKWNNGSQTITELLLLGPITGNTTVCAGGGTSLLGNAVSGGMWSCSNPNIATIGQSSGLVTGVSGGTAIITYTKDTSHAYATVTVIPLPSAGVITGGSSSICIGGTTIFDDTTTGGTWHSSNSSVASVVSSSGVVSGGSPGSATISYVVANSCGTANATVPINVVRVATAGTITGPSRLCAGTSVSMSDVVTGGNWASSNKSILIVDSLTGKVTGVTTGISNISYSVTNSCGTATASFADTVDQFPSAGTITGLTTLCAGLTTSLNDVVAKGLWSSNRPGVALVNLAGVVTAISPGVATINYSVANSCGTASTTTNFTVNPLPSAGHIVGGSSLCVGSAITLNDTVTGGVWSSADTGIAITDSAGHITGLTPGVDTIHYSVKNGCGTATIVAIDSVVRFPLSGIITGTATLCAGATTILADTITGGVWTSDSMAVATIGPTGIVIGISGGTTKIHYAVSSSCGTAFTDTIITVNPLPFPGTITGSSDLCVGSSLMLHDSARGGSWNSNNVAVATVDSNGVVTGVSKGAAIISYSISNGCGTTTATALDTIIGVPSAGLIKGADSVCEGDTIRLSNAVSGGIWKSSNARVTVSAQGIVTGVTPGMDTIVYAVANVCGADSAILPLVIVPSSLCNISVKSLPGAYKLNLFPNPSSGFITIQLPELNNFSLITLTITDIAGRIVETKIAARSQHQVYVDMGNLTGGPYFIKVSGIDGVYIGSVIVVK